MRTAEIILFNSINVRAPSNIIIFISFFKKCYRHVTHICLYTFDFKQKYGEDIKNIYFQILFASVFIMYLHEHFIIIYYYIHIGASVQRYETEV